ncbi:MAG TPA: pilus assembly protein [Pseudolabrys sp.]|nr:pilus assembly protein [Pseudolabrys sp.]
MSKFGSRCRTSLQAFARARSGNVAVMFALALVPVIAAAGAAVDYSRANSVKADLQAALDSTALMLAKEAATDSNADLQAHALSYFKATFNRPGTEDYTVSATYSTGAGSTIVVNGAVSVPTDFMQMFGYNSVTVSSSSTAQWGTSRLRVALVLDNTGSMAQSGKMSALKTATKNLLTQLQSAVTTSGDVYVSIVPFVKDVNFDKSNANATWIDWTDWDANNGSCKGNFAQNQSDCTKWGGTWKPKNHNSWNGCVVDRGDSNGPDIGDYDTNVVTPDPNITATLYAAEQYSSCPKAAIGLSYDWNAMNSLVNSMQPAGNTNQAIGLQAGWMSLVGGGPFTAPPEDANYTYQKVIILLTDGLNTQDRWYSKQSDIDARQEITCNNIKAAGITLYTIQVNTGGDPTSTLLQNCASSSDKFFLLTSADQIVTTFDTIGTNLSKLRVAK